MSKTFRAQRGESFAGYNELTTDVCAWCGVLFAAPKHLIAARRKDGETFYCPNGHSLRFNRGEPEAERLRRQLEEERDWSARLAAERDQTKAALRAQRARATRFKNDRDRERKRMEAGVCPCCNRTFRQLARHMRSQHPEFAGESGSEA